MGDVEGLKFDTVDGTRVHGFKFYKLLFNREARKHYWF